MWQGGGWWCNTSSSAAAETCCLLLLLLGPAHTVRDTLLKCCWSDADNCEKRLMVEQGIVNSLKGSQRSKLLLLKYNAVQWQSANSTRQQYSAEAPQCKINQLLKSACAVRSVYSPSTQCLMSCKWVTAQGCSGPFITRSNKLLMPCANRLAQQGTHVQRLDAMLGKALSFLLCSHQH
jgi:hypothetical protein